MSVVKKFCGYLWGHKNKFIFGSVFIAGSVVLTKYAQQQLIEWKDKETTEFFDKHRKYSHFQSIGRTIKQTVSNISVALLDEINKSVDTDEVIEALKNNPENKLEMWNTLKVLVFTKAAIIIYSMVILVGTLTIQLTLVGGYLYKDPNSLSTDFQEIYLSLCKNFIYDGVNKLTLIVKAEVAKSVGNLELSRQLTFGELEAIFWSIQTKLASHVETPIENYRNIVLSDVLGVTNPIFNHLLKDTADFLESDDVKSLLSGCINQGFNFIGDEMAKYYKSSKDPFLSSDGETVRKIPLAKLIPVINGVLSKEFLQQNFIELLITDESVDILSANIYESLM